MSRLFLLLTVVMLLALHESVLAKERGAVPQFIPEHVLYRFQGGNDGASPSGEVLLRKSAIFGTTANGGGPSNDGTVFMLVRAASGYSEKILHRFAGGADGAHPLAAVVGNAGPMFGTTASGGGGDACSGGCGTVFEIDPKNGYSESIIHAFTGESFDGANPVAALAQSASGALFGTTENGGLFGKGTVFELLPTKSSYTERILHNFRGPPNDGANPMGSLVESSNGTLFGTTFAGGTGNLCNGGCGTAFSLTPSGSTYTETVLHNFYAESRNDGAEPDAALTLDSGGSVYGVTPVGGGDINAGTVFRLTPGSAGYTETIIFTFGGPPAGADPIGPLAILPDGRIYMTVGYGGFGKGDILELFPEPSGYAQVLIYYFSGGDDGAYPSASVVAKGDLDTKGALYGTTSAGGSSCGCGTVYMVTP